MNTWEEDGGNNNLAFGGAYFKNGGYMEQPQVIKIDDVEYVRKDAIAAPAEKLDGMEYCIVRTQSAGVFAGYLESRTGKEAVIRRSRRLWYWDGAATLSQLAVDGVSAPQNCKFPCEVDRMLVIEAIEVIHCTEKARLSIQGVPIWKR